MSRGGEEAVRIHTFTWDEIGGAGGEAKGRETRCSEILELDLEG